MGWIKALAIGVAVILVFSMISVFMHLAYLAIVAIAIGAVVALDAQGTRAAARRAGREDEEGRGRAGPGDVDTASAGGTDEGGTAPAQDVEDELARLKREIEYRARDPRT